MHLQCIEKCTTFLPINTSLVTFCTGIKYGDDLSSGTLRCTTERVV